MDLFSRREWAPFPAKEVTSTKEVTSVGYRLSSKTKKSSK